MLNVIWISEGSQQKKLGTKICIGFIWKIFGSGRGVLSEKNLEAAPC